MIRHDEALHGIGATALVTLAGIEDFGAKLLTSVAVALVSTLVSSLVKKWLSKRESKS